MVLPCWHLLGTSCMLCPQVLAEGCRSPGPAPFGCLAAWQGSRGPAAAAGVAAGSADLCVSTCVSRWLVRPLLVRHREEMVWGCISLRERSVFAYEPAGPAWGRPVQSPLEGSGPQDACHSQCLMGPCENCLGWSHRLPQTAQRKGPSHRYPALQMRGRGRRFNHREKASASGAGSGALSLFEAPTVCPGLWSVLRQVDGYYVLPSSLS